MVTQRTSSSADVGRPHDAEDTDEVLAAVLPRIAASRRGRSVAFARYDQDAGRLVQRWAVGSDGVVLVRDIGIEPARLHPLLADDARGRRPTRPAEDAAAWVVQDLLPDFDPGKGRVRARAVALDGVWYGVLVIGDRGSFLLGGDDDRVHDLGDYLELSLARASRMQAAQELVEVQEAAESTPAPPSIVEEALPDFIFDDGPQADAQGETDIAPDRASEREEALDEAAGRATEMLLEAHIELDRRADRLRRQTRVLHLLREFLDRYAAGVPPRELASELVSLTSKAFGGMRCSLLLAEPGVSEEINLRLAAALGLPSDVNASAVRVRPGVGISGRVARTCEPVVIRDEQEAGDYPLVADGAYTGTAFVSFPLVFQGRMHGVLNVTNFRNGCLDDAQLQQLRTVVLCLSLVVDHARLGERLFGKVASGD